MKGKQNNHKHLCPFTCANMSCLSLKEKVCHKQFDTRVPHPFYVAAIDDYEITTEARGHFTWPLCMACLKQPGFPENQMRSLRFTLKFITLEIGLSYRSLRIGA